MTKNLYCFMASTLLIYIVSSFQYAKQTNQLQQKSDYKIYGVRWRLGNGFNFDQQLRNSEYYLLEFNTQFELQQSIYVKFANIQYTCTHFPYHFKNFTTFIYRCRINQRTLPAQKYTICIETTNYTNSSNPIIDQLNQLVLFSGSLRIPKDNWKIIMLGNVQIKLNNNFSELDQLLQSNRISVMILGNLSPRLSQLDYYQILTKLQIITSSTFTIPIYSSKDEDEGIIYSSIFEYQNNKNYEIISLDRLDFTIVAVNSEEDIGNQIDQKIKMKLRQRNMVMVASQNLQIQNNSIIFYQDINMRIHISPLVDEYSRKKMCWDSASSKICPYILKDGSIQTNKFNYGILEIKLAKVFHYVHYQNSVFYDSFDINYSKQENQQQNDKAKTFQIVRKVIITAESLILFSLSIIILATFLKHKKRNSKNSKSDKHVQLVQQIVNQSLPPQSS